jgi:hypothetical protein
MLNVIITATLLITGIFAPKEQKNQTNSTTVETCLETNGERNKTTFHSKQNTYLFQKNTNQRNENEKETV